MKVMAISHEGDPLFVRDDRGRDFEVETHWVSDARFRSWSQTDSDSKLDRIWGKVFSETGKRRVVPGGSVFSSNEPLLVQAAVRVLVAHLLPSVEERDAQERRARVVERLGAWPAREVADRRHETGRAEWSRKHPKARPSHSSIILPPGFNARIATESMRLIFRRAKMPVFMEVHTASPPAGWTIEPSQADMDQRAEALRRLQDPVAVPSVETDILHLVDGLRRRPVM